MIDERFFEVLRSQLSAEKEEKAALREQLEKLTEEMRIQRESFKSEMASIKEQNVKLSLQIDNMSKQNQNMSLSLEAKDRQIADLVIQFKDAMESVKLGRKNRFAPTTEQRRLLNNRNTDKRAEDKDRFDGSSGSLSGSSEQNTEAEKTASESKKRVKQKQSVAVQKESHYVDEIEALMDFIGDTLKEEVRNTDYLMIDETCELVGIEPNEEQAKSGQGRVYLKKYLWAFYAKLKNLVCYVYEQGSRSRKVVQDFLKKFCGYISTDGYVAYNIFDDVEKHPGIVHVGCWTHCRRLFVEALESDRRAMYCIDEIGGLFAVELNSTLCGLEPEERKVQREKQSVPIMTRLYARAKTMSKDMELMSNSLMRKAVNYLINQWDRLRNFIMDGRVQISNLSGRIHRTSVQLHRTGGSGQKSSFAMLLCQ